MCRDCGYVVGCPHCDISLTYHRFDAKMKCHYCGFESPVPASCPECGSEHIRYFGTGTQKIEEELGKILPEARVIRMDVDTTSRKGSHERIARRFSGGQSGYTFRDANDRQRILIFRISPSSVFCRPTRCCTCPIFVPRRRRFNC